MIENTASVEDETNSYITNKVTNYTVKDEVEKTVYIDGNISTNIDGKVINKGDTLVYAISYKNTSTENATVTITDTIPKHTAYVEGSADNGGVYDNGTLTWTLAVAPGATVTVTFKVVVDIVADVHITNEATIIEGNNTYTTNEVLVTVPTNPNSPQTGVNTRFDIWTILLFVSTTGLIGTVVYEQKKKKITVVDEGVTIEKEEQKLIFDRFYKTDSSRGLDKTGVGLGLYICKTLIDAHNETIGVNSNDGITELYFTVKRAR